MTSVTWYAGVRPVSFPDGSTRTWLEDGDEVTIAASAGLAAVTGRITLPG